MRFDIIFLFCVTKEKGKIIELVYLSPCKLEVYLLLLYIVIIKQFIFLSFFFNFQQVTVSANTYFQNALNVYREKRRMNLRLLYKPVDKSA